MATKNLSRTVIEGGRTRFSQWDRRRSNVEERRRAHQISAALRDAEAFDEVYFAPRDKVYKSFDDKLGPARRFLRSQAGRPWDRVHSELFARFDLRTTAGRHILFDHLLEEVRDEPSSLLSRHNEFSVSRHGILRSHGRERFRAWRPPAPLPEPEQALRDWFGERRVRAQGQHLYWLLATRHGCYRQAQRLTIDEAARFRALPAWFREQFEGAAASTGARR